MSKERLAVLQSMVSQNPSDAFSRYGLAMEYFNGADLDQALAQFQALLAANPGYAAAYYHGGRTLELLGRNDEARTLYEQGIDVTARSGDDHTRSELQAALDLLPSWR